MVMIKASTAGFVAATLALSTTLAVGFVITSPFVAAAAPADRAAERIEGAFELLSSSGIVTSHEAQPVDCASAVWPHLDASCLITADGSRAPEIRVVY
jgi:hypothetical protein